MRRSMASSSTRKASRRSKASHYWPHSLKSATWPLDGYPFVSYTFSVRSYTEGPMLTVKQHELLNFIHQRLSATGVSPSFDEMREALDLKSKSGVHRLISALEERQFIRRLPNRARALEIVKLPETSAPAAASPPSRIMPAAANDTVEI